MYPEDNFEFTPLEQETFDAGLFLMGVVAGAAIGAGVALLFAPQSGRETRHDLAESGAAVKDRVSTGYATLTDRAGATVEDARETVEDWISHTRDTLDETRRRLDAAVEAGREAYEDKKQELDAQVDAALDA